MEGEKKVARTEKELVIMTHMELKKTQKDTQKLKTKAQVLYEQYLKFRMSRSLIFKVQCLGSSFLLEMDMLSTMKDLHGELFHICGGGNLSVKEMKVYRSQGANRIDLCFNLNEESSDQEEYLADAGFKPPGCNLFVEFRE